MVPAAKEVEAAVMAAGGYSLKRFPGVKFPLVESAELFTSPFETHWPYERPMFAGADV